MSYHDFTVIAILMFFFALLLVGMIKVLFEEFLKMNNSDLNKEIYAVKLKIEDIAKNNGGKKSIIFLSMQNEWKNKYQYNLCDNNSLVNSSFLKDELEFKDQKIYKIKRIKLKCEFWTNLINLSKKIIMFLFFISASIFVAVWIV